MSPYTGWNIEEMRKKRCANDGDASSGVAKRSKSEVTFPTLSGFTPVNSGSKMAAISPPPPNSTDETDAHKPDVSMDISAAWGGTPRHIAQYLEGRPRLLPPPATKRKSEHPNKGEKRSSDGKTTDKAVPVEAHVGASGLDSSLHNPQLFTPQNSAKKLSPTPPTKRKRTISSGMPVTKPGLDAYENRRALKPQGNSGTPTEDANNSYTGSDLVSKESLARLDVFRFKPAPASVASADNPGIEGEVPCSLLVQLDAGEPSSASTADDWALSDHVNINSDRTTSEVQPPETPVQKIGSKFLGGHAAQLPSPLDASPITASMASSARAVEIQGDPLIQGLHNISTHTLFSEAAHSGQLCGFQVNANPDGTVWEEKGRSYEESLMEMMSQDVEFEDGFVSSEVGYYPAPQPHLETTKRPAVTAQGSSFGNNDSYIDYEHIMLDDDERTTNELNERTDKTVIPATLRAQKEACDVFSLEGIDDGLDDSDLIDAVTQGCLEASLEHVREASPAPNRDAQEDSEDYDVLFGLLSSPDGTVHTRGANDLDDDDWMELDEEDHGLEAELIDLTDAASSGRAALTPSSSNRQFVKLTGSQPELAVQQIQRRTSTYSTNDETSAVIDVNGPKPIVRPPFPKQVRDRSPIMGLSADSCLRTCFRVGEALNVGCKAVRNNESVFLELYARVISSHREPEGFKQYFVFGDLFHDRLPYIHGFYEVWKGVGLWEYDSSRFLGEQGRGRMCRCIGKMKREAREWKLLVLNIWEATWDDVEHVKGIVCA